MLNVGSFIAVGDLEWARIGVDVDQSSLVRLQVTRLQPSPSELTRVRSPAWEVLRNILPAHFLDLL